MSSLIKKNKTTVVTIGNFDGVHLGHQAIAAAVVAEARKNQAISVVVLFEPHPKEFFLKELAPRRLQGLRDKIKILKNFGIDEVVCLRFNKKFANLTPQEFIKVILRQKLHATTLVLGTDFCFGKNRSGNIATLKEAGFKLIELPTVNYHNAKISSTWLRETILMNDFRLAEKLMNHPYIISGHVIHGNKHGRLLGYPTINLPLKSNIVLHGIYAVHVKLADKIYEGVANVGRRPALNPLPYPLLEVYLFDYHQECYGAIVEVIFITKIREEQNFDTVINLKIQIGKDVELAKKLLMKFAYV
jgi:riboflavin kinase/FMN adenylyltransferase